MWTTNGGFKKAPNYTYMAIPRYFKVGTVSDDDKNGNGGNNDSFVAKISIGVALFLMFYFLIYFATKHVTIAAYLFVVV